jgi:hypothetical protein
MKCAVLLIILFIVETNLLAQKHEKDTAYFNPKNTSRHLKIRNISFGSRIFEKESIGNNPLTIIPFLKNPFVYIDYLNTITYNGLNGNPGIERQRNYYLNVEFYKTSKSRFWKKYSINIGMQITNKLIKDGLALFNERVEFSPTDSIVYTDRYSLVQNQRFFGANLGLNRYFKTSEDRFQFLIGLHWQGSFAVTHNYQQRWDSTIFVLPNTRTTTTTELSKLKGINFFEWQAMMPLGIEIDIYKQRFFIRFEAYLGITKNRYKSVGEAHGLGIWMHYKPK